MYVSAFIGANTIYLLAVLLVLALYCLHQSLSWLFPGANVIYLLSCTVGASIILFAPILFPALGANAATCSAVLLVQRLFCLCTTLPLPSCYMCKHGLLARFPVGARAFFPFVPRSLLPACYMCKRGLFARFPVSAKFFPLHHSSPFPAVTFANVAC